MRLHALGSLGAQLSASEHRVRVDLPPQSLAFGTTLVVDADYE